MTDEEKKKKLEELQAALHFTKIAFYIVGDYKLTAANHKDVTGAHAFLKTNQETFEKEIAAIKKLFEKEISDAQATPAV